MKIKNQSNTLFITLFITLNILYFLPSMSKVYQPIGYLLFAWGGLIFVRDFFGKGTVFTIKHGFILVLFLISYGFSVILSLHSQWFFGALNLAFALISISIIYNAPNKIGEAKRRLMVVNAAFTITVTITTIIALLMFMFWISYRLPNGARQGVFENRLFGLYTSPNIGGMFSYLAILTAYMNRQLFKEIANKKIQKIWNYFSWVAIILNLMYILLAVSRGTNLTIVGALIFATILMLFPYIWSLNKKKYVKLIFFFLLTIGLFGSIYYGVVPARELLLEVPKQIQTIVEVTSDSDDNNGGDIDIVHSVGKADVTTGRSGIWEGSLKMWAKHPLFGIGNAQVLDGNGQEIDHVSFSGMSDENIKWVRYANGYLHNGYVQVLVDSGVIGFGLMLIFFIKTFKDVFKTIFQNFYNQGIDYKIFICLVIAVLSLFINEVVETHIMFNNRDVIGSMFWFFLGMLPVFSASFHKEKTKLESIAFVALTPLHIINILNVIDKDFKDCRLDLYVYHEFDGSHMLEQSLRDLGLFNKVIGVDPSRMGGKLIRNINVLINRNQMVSLEKPILYDAFFYQGGNHFSKILFGKAKKKNPDIKLFYLEDGIVTYIESDISNLMNISKFRRNVFNLVNPYSITNHTIDRAYVYRPDLLKFSDETEVKALPKIKNQSEVYQNIMMVFPFKKPVRAIKNMTIYLEQPFIQDGTLVNEPEILKILRARSEGLIIKLHPRTPRDKYKDVKILDTTLPWELCSLQYKFEGCNIVSVSSTSCFLETMMFEENSKMQYTLLARAVLNDDAISGNREALIKIDAFIERMHHLFPNIAIPEHLEDF